MDFKAELIKLSNLNFENNADKFEASLKKIGDTFDPVNYINSEVTSVFNHNRHNSRVLSHTELMVTYHRDTGLSLYFLKNTPSETLSTLGQHLGIYALADIEALEIYEYGKNNIDCNETILNKKTVYIPKGNTYILNAERYLIGYHGVNEIPMLALKVERESVLNFQFDSKSGELLMQSPIYPMITQLKAAADLLGNFGSSNHLDALNQLLDYKFDASVRWEALKSISRLSREDTIKALQKLTLDKNSKLSSLAKQHLERV